MDDNDLDISKAGFPSFEPGYEYFAYGKRHHAIVLHHIDDRFAWISVIEHDAESGWDGVATFTRRGIKSTLIQRVLSRWGLPGEGIVWTRSPHPSAGYCPFLPPPDKKIRKGVKHG